MDMEPRKIESMDDLRAAWKDPEIIAANKEFSRRYLKANRPKSVAVAVFLLVAVFAYLSISNLKISMITPSALRTVSCVEVHTEEQKTPVALSEEERSALLELLGQYIAKNTDEKGYLPDNEAYFYFDCGGKAWFAVTESGSIMMEDHRYAVQNSDIAARLWTSLTQLMPC